MLNVIFPNAACFSAIAPLIVISVVSGNLISFSLIAFCVASSAAVNVNVNASLSSHLLPSRPVKFFVTFRFVFPSSSPVAAYVFSNSAVTISFPAIVPVIGFSFAVKPFGIGVSSILYVSPLDKPYILTDSLSFKVTVPLFCTLTGFPLATP